MTIKEFNISRTNRSVSERIKPGGKGINVSIVLKNLGIDSTVMGFVAGSPVKPATQKDIKALLG
ncbi:MAG: hypothetical protein ACI4EV_03230 [Lachnospiraceae bacterium]